MSALNDALSDVPSHAFGALERDALAGAGLTPAIDRLKLSIELAPSFGGGVRLSPEFAQSLIALMVRCRDTQEYLNEQIATQQVPLTDELAAQLIRMVTDFAGADFRDALRLLRATEETHGIARSQS